MSVSVSHVRRKFSLLDLTLDRNYFSSLGKYHLGEKNPTSSISQPTENCVGASMRVCVWQKSFWVRKPVSKARPHRAETLASLREYVPGRKTQKFSAQEENRKRNVHVCAHGHVCGQQMNASLSLCPFLQRKIYMVFCHKGKRIPSHTRTRRNVLSSLTNRASLEKHTLSSPECGLMCVSPGRDLPPKVSLKVSVVSRNTHVHTPHTTSGWSGSAMTCVRVCVHACVQDPALPVVAGVFL